MLKLCLVSTERHSGLTCISSGRNERWARRQGASSLHRKVIRCQTTQSTRLSVSESARPHNSSHPTSPRSIVCSSLAHIVASPPLSSPTHSPRLHLSPPSPFLHFTSTSSGESPRRPSLVVAAASRSRDHAVTIDDTSRAAPSPPLGLSGSSSLLLQPQQQSYTYCSSLSYHTHLPSPSLSRRLLLVTYLLHLPTSRSAPATARLHHLPHLLQSYP